MATVLNHIYIKYLEYLEEETSKLSLGARVFLMRHPKARKKSSYHRVGLIIKQLFIFVIAATMGFMALLYTKDDASWQDSNYLNMIEAVKFAFMVPGSLLVAHTIFIVIPFLQRLMMRTEKLDNTIELRLLSFEEFSQGRSLPPRPHWKLNYSDEDIYNIVAISHFLAKRGELHFVTKNPHLFL